MCECVFPSAVVEEKSNETCQGVGGSSYPLSFTDWPEQLTTEQVSFLLLLCSPVKSLTWSHMWEAPPAAEGRVCCVWERTGAPRAGLAAKPSQPWQHENRKTHTLHALQLQNLLGCNGEHVIKKNKKAPPPQRHVEMHTLSYAFHFVLWWKQPVCSCCIRQTSWKVCKKGHHSSLVDKRFIVKGGGDVKPNHTAALLEQLELFAGR